VIPAAPLRVILPALVSVLSGLWAIAEWRAGRSDVLDVGPPEPAGNADDSDWREREARRIGLAERKQRLAEQREARLAARDHRPAPDTPA
jgi:hypothetical protein